MANDFIVFLIGGLIALAVLMVFFGSPQLSSNFNVNSGSKITADIPGLITIGPKDVETYKTFVIGDFKTSYVMNEKLYTVESGEVYNGLLFGSNNIKYNWKGRNVQNLKIHFKVTKSNEYGPLTVKVNGAVVAQRVYPVGEYDIFVPTNLLADDLTIEIEALSSGWKIWAPAFYKLEDVRLLITAYALDYTEFRFDVQDAYDTFRSGSVDLSFTKYTGVLNTELNGRVIYSGPVMNIQSIRLDKSDLRKGQNSLVFKGNSGSEFEGNARATVFYTKTEESILRMPLNLTDSQYNGLYTGRIIFKLESVSSPGGVNIRIEPRNSFSEYQTAREKTFTLTFTKDNVAPGINYVIIQSQGGAVFEITEPSVVI